MAEASAQESSGNSGNNVDSRYWEVAPKEDANGQKDINFKVLKAGCPTDQQNLKDEIERTLSAIKIIYPGVSNKNFNASFEKLLGLAQVGLAGMSPSTSVAQSALISLKYEILDRESGRVKNAYMLKLGGWALAFFIVSVLSYVFIGLCEFSVPAAILKYRNFCLLWAGAMAGVWCSFASRKTILGFFDLVKLEEDQVDPPLRLIFSGILTVIIGFIFTTGFANLVIGAFEGANILKSGAVSFLIGALSGMAEKALPGAVMQRAQALLQFDQKR